MIRLKNVSKIYYNKGVIGTGFSKISLDFEIGEFIAITGESGSGKSTLLNVISGLDTYEEGEMYINGKETSHYTEEDFEDYRRKYVANIFQGFNLVNSYTVKQNVELVLLLNGYEKFEVKEKVDKILKDVGLYELRDKKVSKLSGGQKQRVAIARALAKETPIIVADEPTGNLDKESSAQIIKLLNEISKNKLVIIVTHNFEQVEKYVTRVIRMHDGKVVEDKKVKEVKSEKVELSEFYNMSFKSKFELAFRNTFNIVGKLLLILGVFIVCVCGILTNIGGNIKAKHQEMSNGIASVFKYNDTRRIIIRHKDKTPFTDEEYDKILKIKNVDWLEKNDYKLDTTITVFSSEEETYFNGSLKNINNLNLKVEKGRLPEKDDELLLVASKDDFYVKFFAGDFIDKTFYTTSDYGEKGDVKVKIVGLAFDNDPMMEYKFYTSDELIEKLYKVSLRYSSHTEFKIENNTYDSYNLGNLVISDKVLKGSIYLGESFNTDCKDYNCKNKDIIVKINSFYSSNEDTLKVSEIINKNNYKLLTDFTEYEYARDKIYMNIDDFNRINKIDNYQSSVFVKDVDHIYDVTSELEKMGIQVLPIKDSVDYDGSDLAKLISLFQFIGSMFTFVCLYAISYFVIFLIMKSRNTYFAIVRILGGNVKTCRQLLNLELFISSTLSFLIVSILAYLFKYNIIPIDLLSGYMDYLKWYHFVLGYALIIILSQLISRKFSKKIFKDSMITTYNMEV